MPKSTTPPGLQQYKELERQTKRERPTQRVGCAMDIGDFVATIRRGLAIRQIDLATRAKVGRHWLMALEQGKQSCEVELVMRTRVLRNQRRNGRRALERSNRLNTNAPNVMVDLE